MVKDNFSCARDSLTIRGTVYRRGDSLRQPIVICSHEFMANRLFVRSYAKMFAELGYAAFTYDFCGGCIVGSSDGNTTDMTVLTEKEDLKAVLEYARSQPYTDEDRITLLGCSQGGLVSALAAAELQDRIDTLILIYPALSIPDDARKGEMIIARFDPAQIPESFRCGPMKLGRGYAATAQELDPYEDIAGYHGNVLIIHGDQDDLVPLSYSEKAYSAYLAARKDRLPDWKGERALRMHVIKGAGHVFTKPSHLREALGHIQGFLTETEEASMFDPHIDSDHIFYTY